MRTAWIAIVAALVIASGLVATCPAQQDGNGQGRQLTGSEQPTETDDASREQGGQDEKDAAGSDRAKDANQGQGGQGGQGGGGGGMFGGFELPLILLGVLALMYFLSSRTRRKQENERREMLGSLKKGDKVTTIGGVVGTVMDVRDDEITVKVDENNNIRMTFARWGVRGVGDQAKTETPEDRK
jgi:preprotein translocase subunit YajC